MNVRRCFSAFISSQQYRTKHNKSYVITTPIFYVNSAPHIGHAYTVCLADSLARWHRFAHYERTILSTGTDEHGLKIQQAASQHGLTPQKFCNSNSAVFNRVFDVMGVEAFDFIRTTEQRHKIAVSHFWNQLKLRGWLYKAPYTGWYCAADEAFIGADQVIEQCNGWVTKDGGQSVEWSQEDNWMFRLSAFYEKILTWLRTDVVKPMHFGSQLLHWLELQNGTLSDLSVSRSVKRHNWGISVPDDPSQTIYVWLDALVNYLTVCGYPEKTNLWPADVHVVGKDILKFHALYWPAFLMAAELPLPKEIVCHSHWLMDNMKMSKSRGNVLDPLVKANEYTAEGLRYFLLRQGPLDSDMKFNDDLVVEVLNNELCNLLGNILSRCCSKEVNPQQAVLRVPDAVTLDEQDFVRATYKLCENVAQRMELHQVHFAADLIMNHLRAVDRLLQRHQPWLSSCQEDRRGAVLGIALEGLRVCGTLLQPLVPQLSARLLDELMVPLEERLLCHCLGPLPSDRRAVEMDNVWRPLRSGGSRTLFTRLKHKR